MIITNINSKLKQISDTIDSLYNRVAEIHKIRESKNYSKAILKCNDSEAIELIEIYNQMDILELKEDTLRNQLKELQNKQYSLDCIEAHKPFNDFKYRVDITNNNNKKTHYTNDIEPYKNTYDNNITIMEYIEYNNKLNKEVNKPILKTVYKYEQIEGYKYKVDRIINQTNNTDYKEIYTNIENNNQTIHEYGLDNNNNDIYYRINDFISIHNNYGSAIFKTIQKDKNSDCYYVSEGLTRYKTELLSKDLQDMIYKLFKKLENNKQYKYNISQLKEILNI